MTRGNYNTKQKDIILNIIKKYNKDFTVKDIYLEVKDTTSITTIYRLVDKLTKDGLLNKMIGKDNNTYYQYIERCSCNHHFYLKCNNCGILTHVECDFIDKLTDHIINHHKFIPNSRHIIINGICEKCKEVF